MPENAQIWHFFGDPSVAVRLFEEERRGDELCIVRSYPADGQENPQTINKVLLVFNKPILSSQVQVAFGGEVATRLQCERGTCFAYKWFDAGIDCSSSQYIEVSCEDGAKRMRINMV